MAFLCLFVPACVTAAVPVIFSVLRDNALVFAPPVAPALAQAAVVAVVEYAITQVLILMLFCFFVGNRIFWYLAYSALDFVYAQVIYRCGMFVRRRCDMAIHLYNGIEASVCHQWQTVCNAIGASIRHQWQTVCDAIYLKLEGRLRKVAKRKEAELKNAECEAKLNHQKSIFADLNPRLEWTTKYNVGQYEKLIIYGNVEDYELCPGQWEGRVEEYAIEPEVVVEKRSIWYRLYHGVDDRLERIQKLNERLQSVIDRNQPNVGWLEKQTKVREDRRVQIESRLHFRRCQEEDARNEAKFLVKIQKARDSPEPLSPSLAESPLLMLEEARAPPKVACESTKELAVVDDTVVDDNATKETVAAATGSSKAPFKLSAADVGKCMAGFIEPFSSNTAVIENGKADVQRPVPDHDQTAAAAVGSSSVHVEPPVTDMNEDTVPQCALRDVLFTEEPDDIDAATAGSSNTYVRPSLAYINELIKNSQFEDDPGLPDSDDESDDYINYIEPPPAHINDLLKNGPFANEDDPGFPKDSNDKSDNYINVATARSSNTYVRPSLAYINELIKNSQFEDDPGLPDSGDESDDYINGATDESSNTYVNAAAAGGSKVLGKRPAPAAVSLDSPSTKPHILTDPQEPEDMVMDDPVMDDPVDHQQPEDMEVDDEVDPMQFDPMDIDRDFVKRRAEDDGNSPRPTKQRASAARVFTAVGIVSQGPTAPVLVFSAAPVFFQAPAAPVFTATPVIGQAPAASVFVAAPVSVVDQAPAAPVFMAAPVIAQAPVELALPAAPVVADAPEEPVLAVPQPAERDPALARWIDYIEGLNQNRGALAQENASSLRATQLANERAEAERKMQEANMRFTHAENKRDAQDRTAYKKQMMVRCRAVQAGIAERTRLAKEQARREEQESREEQARQEEQERREEQARIEKARVVKLREARYKADNALILETYKLAKEARLAKQERVAKEQACQAEQEARLAEQARQEEQERQAEQARQAEAAHQAEVANLIKGVPVTEGDTIADESPVAEEAPVAEGEAPIAKDASFPEGATIAQEETSVVGEDVPMDEAPATEEAPLAEDGLVSEDATMAEEEAPIAKDTSVSEGATIAEEETSVVEEKTSIAEEDAPMDEAPATEEAAAGTVYPQKELRLPYGPETFHDKTGTEVLYKYGFFPRESSPASEPSPTPESTPVAESIAVAEANPIAESPSIVAESSPAPESTPVAVSVPPAPATPAVPAPATPAGPATPAPATPYAAMVSLSLSSSSMLSPRERREEAMRNVVVTARVPDPPRSLEVSPAVVARLSTPNQGPQRQPNVAKLVSTVRQRNRQPVSVFAKKPRRPAQNRPAQNQPAQNQPAQNQPAPPPPPPP